MKRTDKTTSRKQAARVLGNHELAQIKGGDGEVVLDASLELMKKRHEI